MESAPRARAAFRFVVADASATRSPPKLRTATSRAHTTTTPYGHHHGSGQPSQGLRLALPLPCWPTAAGGHGFQHLLHTWLHLAHHFSATSLGADLPPHMLNCWHWRSRCHATVHRHVTPPSVPSLGRHTKTTTPFACTSWLHAPRQYTCLPSSSEHEHKSRQTKRPPLGRNTFMVWVRRPTQDPSARNHSYTIRSQPPRHH